MCGIYAHFGISKKYDKNQYLSLRGPDDYREYNGDDYLLAFYRLSIVGLNNGMQPFDMDGIHLICNGEIYNHKILSDSKEVKSDCESILISYKKYGIDKTIRLLDGEFAFVLVDEKKRLVHFARDYMGIKPLYYSKSMNDGKVSKLEVSSLIKGLSNRNNIEHVKPGYLYTYDMNNKVLSYERYYSLGLSGIELVDDNELVYKNIFNKFNDAIIKRIQQSERQVGFLLSGGLDSSLVLSLALEYLKDKNAKPMVFTFGYSEDAPDVKSAEIVVEFLREKYGENSFEWHLVIGGIDESLRRLPEVIIALETYDTTTIRASTPMYMISEYISKYTNVKVILSGEGSDELFGGYLYFKYAPNDFAFRSEIKYLLENLYYYDVLRADRVTACHGLEVRPPFLDRELVEYVLKCPMLCKGKNNTKELLRDSIRWYENNYKSVILPNDILFGKKEAFSDAVGLSWKDAIATMTDSYMKNYEKKYESIKCGHIKPDTNEQKYFQLIFSVLFGDRIFDILPSLWLPNQQWVNTGSEPSARILDVYSGSKK